MFLVPHCGIFSKLADGTPILNPAKPLNFSFTMIYKIEESSLMYRVKGVDSESQHISLIAEIVPYNNVPCLNRYTAQ